MSEQPGDEVTDQEQPAKRHGDALEDVVTGEPDEADAE
jgi:hypothetical protein